MVRDIIPSYRFQVKTNGISFTTASVDRTALKWATRLAITVRYVYIEWSLMKTAASSRSFQRYKTILYALLYEVKKIDRDMFPICRNRYIITGSNTKTTRLFFAE